jgi:hypothetical protein
MLQTDLNGFINEIKTNKTCHFILLVIICIIIYWIMTKYLPEKNKFINLYPNIIYGVGNERCNSEIPKLDEVIFRNMINLPNRNPEYLTSSMVIPKKQHNNEDQRKTRMDILNMFYDTFNDNIIDINNRPQGLYLTP